MTIEQFIKMYRHENNLTLTDFAKMINADISAVLGWEDDLVHPEIQYLYEISSVTGVPMHILVNKKALENYGIPRKRVVYNIGLHTLFEAVYDVKTFICFLDAISGAIRLTTPRIGTRGLLFLGHLPDNSKFDFISDMVGINDITFDYKKQMITLISQGNIMVINNKNIVAVKPCEYCNNKMYGFLFYRNNTTNPAFRLDIGIYY